MESPRCGDGDPSEQVTGDSDGHLSADGRSASVDCSSIVDAPCQDGDGTYQIQMKLSGQLQLGS